MKLIAAVSMLVLNLVLEHVSTLHSICGWRNDDTSAGFKSIYKSLRVILGVKHTPRLERAFYVFMVK